MSMHYFTSSELRSILTRARFDRDSWQRNVRYAIRRMNETGGAEFGYWGFKQDIAEGLREMASLRKLIAHTKAQLPEALERERQRGNLL